MAAESKKTESGQLAGYRGRIAPTPTGWMHLGHASTFKRAWERARNSNGTLVYRLEDIDPDRCRADFANGAIEDLRWWGLDWDEGPDMGGPFAPYIQSQRMELFEIALKALAETGHVYPSPESRKEISAAKPLLSPVDGDPVFPDRFRPSSGIKTTDKVDPALNWRFRVPDGRSICYHDQRCGDKQYQAGKDFGDFLVWRKTGVPSYELAVVVDDHYMNITEVVRGEDLLLSTARQILLYEALGWEIPKWYHCPLVIDPSTGIRLSKTHRSLGLRNLREKGYPPGLPVETYFAS